MKKLVYVVCGVNASRSQAIAEFLGGEYSDSPEIKIKSAGLDVYRVGQGDKRTLFTREMAKEADVILVSDHDKFYRTNYFLLKNDADKTKKVHLLGIPDIFQIHKNAYLGKDIQKYVDYLERINQEPEFSALRKHVSHLTPEAASALMEALYIKEMYSAHRSQEPIRRDEKYSNAPWNESLHKRYPFELLYKTLEFRFPEISRLIEK